MTELNELDLDQDDAAQRAADLTRSVGVRVRALRSRRGLTRKNLAFHSDVSERYLARVESGEANISVVLLSQIAQALDVPVLSLLPQEPGGSLKYEPLENLLKGLDENEQQRVYNLIQNNFHKDAVERTGVALVGLRGAGKSTLGALLAQHYKVPFVRLDKLITQMSGLDMSELISLTGQRIFRRYEREALEKTISDYRQVVVEAGGSLVSEPETYHLLRSNYCTVWVRADPEDHLDRVNRQGDTRPIRGSRQPMTELKLILEERSQDYQLADHELMTSNRTIKSCVNELSRIAEPYLKS